MLVVTFEGKNRLNFLNARRLRKSPLISKHGIAWNIVQFILLLVLPGRYKNW